MDFPLDLQKSLVNSAVIIEKADSVPPDCRHFHYDGTIAYRYIFPISIQQAMQIFPSKDGLERIVGMPDIKLGEEDPVPYRFFKYKGTPNNWDIAIAYDDSNGQPTSLYLIRGKMTYIDEKSVPISEPYDIVFNFGANNENINGNFNLDNLKDYIIHAYYTCNAGERWLLQTKFEKHKPKKEKQKKPKEYIPKMRAQIHVNSITTNRKRGYYPQKRFQ